jgi:hypothetical protein
MISKTRSKPHLEWTSLGFLISSLGHNNMVMESQKLDEETNYT